MKSQTFIVRISGKQRDRGMETEGWRQRLVRKERRREVAEIEIESSDRKDFPFPSLSSEVGGKQY